LKRLLVHSSALNLGLLLRRLLGVGTPRGLQARVAAILAAAGYSGGTSTI
jgi:transposase